MQAYDFKPVLITQESLRLTTWDNTEWFGVHWPYVPYWDANEDHVAYGRYLGGVLNLEIADDFIFLAVFLNGEFLCSFETSGVIDFPSVLSLKNMGLISNSKGIQRAVCSSK